MGGKSGARKSLSKTEEKDNPANEQATSENYTVEKIVADRIIKGKTQYKVHWAGYETDEETWENESQLDCNELLEDYLAEKKYSESDSETTTSTKSAKRSKSSKQSEVPSKKQKETPEEPKTPEENSSGENEQQEYVVDKIVGKRKKNGKFQFKIHWEGYTTEEDSWENESQLDCKDLIAEYLDENGESDVNKEQKSAKKKSHAQKVRIPKQKPGPVSGENEYEIEKILDMHTLKTGKRKFLVRWSGFTKDDDTWEPEENVEGTQILERFLVRVKILKELPAKDLRMNRKPTDRFTAMPQGDKRRQSKRHANKQRVKYYDAE